MESFDIAIGIAVILAGVAGMVLLIAADRTRYLTRFDLAHWNDRVYLAMLPNFLRQLHDRRLAPWPIGLNALAAWLFRLKVRTILKARPVLTERHFVREHLNLQALLFQLRPFIDDAILGEKQRLAAARVAAMADNADRDRLARFVAAVREHRLAFANGMTVLDRRILREIRDRDLMGILRSANAMFHEHGFDLLPELDAVRRWETLDGSELVQELPRLVTPASRRRAFADRLGLVPSPRGRTS